MRRFLVATLTVAVLASIGGAATDAAAQSAPPIMSDHGGVVMSGQVTVYPFWYGTWSTAQKAVLKNFIHYLGGGGPHAAPYMNILSTYQVTPQPTPATTFRLGASVAYPGYPDGKNLTDNMIRALIEAAITSRLSPDGNGIYLFLTAPDVTESSGGGHGSKFPTSFCSWHSYTNLKTETVQTDIKYAFVGDPAQALNDCAPTWNEKVSPNGDPGVDAMTNQIAHVLDETLTDPGLNAWYDQSGNEDAAECNWTFGTTTTATNGSQYNITLGAKHYLIQENWVNHPPKKAKDADGYCSMHYP